MNTILKKSQDNNDPANDNDANVTASEKELLAEAFDPSYDEDTPIDTLALDNADDDGEPLEEKGLDSDLFGEDLDDDLVEEEDEESEGER